MRRRLHEDEVAEALALRPDALNPCSRFRGKGVGPQTGVEDDPKPAGRGGRGRGRGPGRWPPSPPPLASPRRPRRPRAEAPPKPLPAAPRAPPTLRGGPAQPPHLLPLPPRRLPKGRRPGAGPRQGQQSHLPKPTPRPKGARPPPLPRAHAPRRATDKSHQTPLTRPQQERPRLPAEAIEEPLEGRQKKARPVSDGRSAHMPVLMRIGGRVYSAYAYSGGRGRGRGGYEGRPAYERSSHLFHPALHPA